MDRLRKLIVFGGALSLLLPALSSMAQSSGDGSEIAYPVDGMGKKYEIVLKAKEPGHAVTDAGELARLDNEFIVLRNGTRTTWVDTTVPFLGHLPLVGRLFRYTAVKTEKVSGGLKVRRGEVARVEIAE